jgi:hypothetical protein
MGSGAPSELRFALARVMMEAGDARTVQAVLANAEPDAITTALAAAMLGQWSEAEQVLRNALEAEKDNAVVSAPLRQPTTDSTPGDPQPGRRAPELWKTGRGAAGLDYVESAHASLDRRSSCWRTCCRAALRRLSRSSRFCTTSVRGSFDECEVG